ncbi:MULTISPECIES: sulfur carrier protein ThiS [Phyllobacteriaceae]|uniref:sulfur carrier protein ThiS n=1 Tax=Phyllobacteriaceae TaxID=69277 RepID=UPI002ACA90B1|nr:sulfur carrier protein ThiS [Chelativorans sp. M5D2P16]MDZ5700103.1 sulfur carrier protein ThiS [Chelativorans sp. M5D2P16]
MKLIVNGQTLEAEAQSLAALLAELGYEGDWYATAVNAEFVPGEEREQIRLSDGDRVEILTPRQGG